MGGSIVVGTDSVTVTDKDGNTTTLKKETTDASDEKAGKFKVAKTSQESGHREHRDDPRLIDVDFSEQHDSSIWSFNKGAYAFIEVHCPPEGAKEKPTITVSVNNPHVDATIELKDHEEQTTKIKEVKKMFGEHK
jgi:hypothetical protein